ncbi:MAG: Hpt domain-containing protein, partial [Hungatella sp.]
MDNGMDNMLDMYLFETNSLLDQLDELLIDAEKVSDFSIDNVNEIFRIMHTIKGSSAMMEFSSLMTIAHQIEDLFFYIRENGIEQLNDSCKRDLFDLMFRSNDYLRAEVGKVENNQPLTTNIDNFISEINTFLDKIRSGGVSATSTANAVLVENAAVPSGINTKHAIRIYFDDNAEMENLRAFMLVNSLREAELSFTFIPADVETREDSKTDIIENGFVLIFESSVDADSAISIIQANGNIRSYEFLEEPEEKQSEDAVSTVSADTADISPTAPDSGSAVPKAATAAAPNHGVATKQSLISVNLSKLDSLMAIVGEIVITESMVTSSPELRDLKLDSFLKSSRQLRSLTDELQDIAMSLR